MVLSYTLIEYLILQFSSRMAVMKKRIYFATLLLSLFPLFSAFTINQTLGFYRDDFTDTTGIEPGYGRKMIYEEGARQLARTTAFFSTSQICYGVKEAGGSIYLIATQDNTTARIYNLNTGLLLTTINLPTKGSKSSYGSALADGTPFKVIADKPVNAALINKAAGQPGATFYPASDTQTPMGKEFIFEAPFSASGRIRAFNPNTTAANLIINNSSVYTILPRSSFAFPQASWSVNQTLTVKSDQPITIQTTSYGNSATTVPATDAANAGLGSGREFYFVTDDSWSVAQPLKGAIVVFPYDNNVNINIWQIYDDTTPQVLRIAKTGLERGKPYFYHGMDNNGTGANSNSRFRLESTGNVEVWAGGLEFDGTYKDTLCWLGDDISYAGGHDLPNGGREYFVHAMTHRDYLLSPFDGVHVTLDTLNQANQYVNILDTTLNKDDWFFFGKQYTGGAGFRNESYMTRITCSKPVFIMTSGGNGYNDWATNLPGMRLVSDRGEIYTKEIRPQYLKQWNGIRFADSLATSTQIYYQVEYDSSGIWRKISNFDLPGNDFYDGNPFGFRGYNGRFVDSVNFALLDTAKYKALRLHAQSGTANKLDMNSNPRLNGFNLSWVAYGEPVFTTPLADQTVNVVNGGSFSSFDLDNHVFDLDDPLSSLSWSVRGNNNLNIYIDNSSHIASISLPTANWYGTEKVIYRVTDPDNNFAEDTVYYKVIRQDLKVSKSAISFGNIRVGNTVRDSLYVKNRGTDTLRVTSLSGVSAPFAFKNSQLTNFKLKPGDSAFVTILFNPTNINQFAKTLTIATNDPLQPLYNAALSGRGVTEDIDAPAALVLGNVCIQTIKKDTIQVQNLGNYPLQLTGFSGLDGVIFKYKGLAAYNIPAGQKVKLPVEFRPIALGTRSDTLVIVNSDPDENPWRVRLTGSGVNPVISADATVLDYGAVNTAISKRDTLRIQNIGSDSLFINNSISLIPPFSYAGIIGKLRLGINESCRLILDFDPELTGSFKDTLRLVSNDLTNSPLKIALKGQGVYQKYFNYDNKINFGSILKNSSKKDSTVIYNIGSDILNVTALSYPASPFSSASFIALPKGINPGDSLVVRMNYAPADTGSFKDTLVINSNDAALPFQLLTVEGKSIFPALSGGGSIAFSKVSVGANRSDSVYIKNRGSAPLHLTAYSALQSVFSRIRPTAPKTINPGDSLFVVIRFTPTQPQAYLDSLLISNDAGSSHKILLTGIGTTAQISSVLSLDFGEILNNTQTDRTLALNSTGNGTLTVSSLSGLKLPFEVVSPLVPPVINIAAGGSRVINLRFRPAVTGMFKDTLLIANNSANSPVQRVILQGKSVAPTALLPATLNFGDATFNSIVNKSVTLKNSGTAILTIFSYGQPELPFSILNPVTITILPNDSLVLNLRFRPSAKTLYSDTLLVFHDDFTHSPSRLILNGRGTEPQLTVPDSLLFSITPGQFQNKTLTISNTGTDLLTVQNLEFLINQPFTKISGPATFPFTIAAGSSVPVVLRFAPVDAGLYSGQVKISSNDPASPLKIVELQGLGDGPEIVCQNNLNFGYYHIYNDQPFFRSFKIKNIGTQPLSLGSISGFNTYFQSAGSWPAAILAGDSLLFSVRFDALEQLGALSAQLSFNCNDFNEGSQTISLGGHGYQGVGKIHIAQEFQLLNFGSVELLRDSLRQFEIQNNGDGPLLGTIKYPPFFKGENDEDSLNFAMEPTTIQQFSVKFKPVSALVYNSNLTIASNDTTADSIYTYPQLTARGIEPAVFFLPSEDLDFGKKRLFRLHTQTVVVQNRGDAPLRVAGIHGLKTNSVFRLLNPADTLFTVLPGEYKELELGFYPSQAQIYLDTLQFYYNHFDGTPALLTLQGEGKIPLPKLAFQNSGSYQVPFLDFGNVQLNATKTLNFNVYNRGDSTLTGQFAPVAGEFDLTVNGKKYRTDKSNPIQVTIAEGGFLTGSASFSPSVLYTEMRDSLELSSNDDTTPEFIHIQMRGMGVIDGAALSFAPQELDFGYIHQDSTKTLSVTVENIGTLPLFGQIKIPAHFTMNGLINSPSGDYLLNPGVLDTLQVTFVPDSVGNFDSLLTLTSNDLNFATVTIPLTARAITNGPAMVVSVDSLDFGQIFVNHEKNLSYNIINVGSGNLVVNLSALGTSDFSSQSGNINLSAGQSLNLPVRYKPLTAGADRDTIQISSSNSTLNPLVDLILKGSAIITDPFLVPDSLDFDTIWVNTQKIDSFVVDNLSGENDFTFKITPTAAFTLENGYNGFFTIPAGQDSIIRIIFHPTTGDSLYSANLQLIGISQPWNKLLGVRGYSLQPKPRITVSPNAYDFGTTLQNSEKSFVFTLKNSGIGSLSGSLANNENSFSFSRITKSNFKTTQRSADNFLLNGGDSLQYLVKFKPLTTGLKKDSIVISSNSLTNNLIRVPLQGLVIQNPVLALSADSLNFGSVHLGTDSILSLKVYNSGADTLRGSLQNLNPVFTFIQNNKAVKSVKLQRSSLNFVLANTDTLRLAVKFQPDALADFKDSLKFISNSYQNPQNHVLLKGKGIAAPTPLLAISADSLNFGNVHIGQDSTINLKIYNAGADTLRGSVDNQNSAFSFLQTASKQTLKLKRSSLNFKLSSSDTLRLAVKFTPLAAASYRDSLTILSNSSAGIQNKVKLLGNGLQALVPVLAISADSLNFGSVKIGHDSTMTVKIYNAGVDTLKGSAANFTSFFGFQSAVTKKLIGKNAKSSINFALTAIDTLRLQVKFTPLAAVNYRDSLKIVTNGSGVNSRSVKLTGIGIATPVLPPLMSVWPDSLIYDTLAVNSTAQKVFMIKNEGGTLLSGFIKFPKEHLTVIFNNSLGKAKLLSLQKEKKRTHRPDKNASGYDSLAFALNGNATGTFLTAFTPDSARAYLEYIHISSNDTTAGGQKSLPVRGVAKDGEISFRPDSLLFGLVTVDSIRSRSTRLRNLSNNSFTVYGFGGLSDGFSPAFTASDSAALPITVAAGDSVDLHFAFQPAYPATYRDTAKVFINQDLSVSIPLYLFGTGTYGGTAQGSSIIVRPSEIDLGNLIAGNTYDGDFTVKNGDLAGTTIGFSFNFNSRIFRVNEKSGKKLQRGKSGSKDYFFYYLNSGDSLNFEVKLTMNDEAQSMLLAGQFQARVQIYSDASSNPVKYVTVKGHTGSTNPNLNSFNLLKPENNQEIYASGVQFSWQSATNASIDGSIDYTLYLYHGNQTDSLVTNSTTISGGNLLKANVPYSWTVKAKYGYLEKWADQTWKFEIKQKGDISPNPFTPDSPDPDYAQAKFDIYDQLPDISVKIYSVDGKFLRHLPLNKEEGHWTAFWNGRNRHGDLVGPGVYLYQVYSGNKVLRNGFIGVVR